MVFAQGQRSKAQVCKGTMTKSLPQVNGKGLTCLNGMGENQFTLVRKIAEYNTTVCFKSFRKLFSHIFIMVPRLIRHLI